MNATSKYCAQCSETKPVDDFHRDRRSPDGRTSHCKACRSTYHARWQAGRLDVHAERQREYRQANKPAARSAGAKWAASERGREVRRAQAAVQRAVRAGSITRPDTCAGCGSEGPVEGHHDDYSRPLDVRWLCMTCHHAEHGRVLRVAQ